MKTQELMLNDLVYAIVDGQKKIIIVRGIEFAKIRYQEGAKIYDCHNFEPIPITEEILKKNEFELDEEASNDFGFECYTFPLGKGFYIEHHNKYMITDHQLMEFKYVHELQHVLKLCGITKEIII